MTLNEALEDFFAEQEYKGNSAATINFYRENLKHFLKDTGVADLEGFNQRTIRSWLIEHRHVKRTTLATYDRALRVVSNWLYRRGYFEANPMADLPKPRARRVEIVTFSEVEIRSMIRVAKTMQNPLREQAMLTLFLDTGIRRRELSDLQLNNVDWAAGWLLIEGKTGERAVPFGRKAKLGLRRYVDQGRRAVSPRVRNVFLNQHGQPFRVDAITHQVQDIARIANARGLKAWTAYIPTHIRRRVHSGWR